jgi:peptidyl-dipeptidase Dcp
MMPSQSTRPRTLRIMFLLSTLLQSAIIPAGAIAFGFVNTALAAASDFGPANPFYAPSTLPFQAPPFDKIKDEDFQPALEAGMQQQQAEIQAIADNPAAPTFDNTIVAMEKTGRLLDRAASAFFGVTGANTNPTLQQVKTIEAPKMAAHQDFIYLNTKLFARVAAIYKQRAKLNLDPESLRVLERYYDDFVHAGANLSEADKTELKKLNEEISTLSDAFNTKLLAATKDGAFTTTDKAALAGLSDARIAAAEQSAKGRKVEGFVVPLQNTTQQPDLVSLTDRATRQAIFEHSWNRTERGDANDTRDTIAHLAQLRARKAKLLGYPSFAAWKLEDQMAKTPEAALKFMDAIVPAATAQAAREAADIQSVIDSQKGGFKVEAYDWNFYAEQVRKARYDIDDAQVKPYFELDNVLQNGVFYAATQLYGITFKERHDIPVYQPDVRVFEVFNADGSHLAIFYCDYFKRDNKNGGAWMSEFVGQSHLLDDRSPVVYNVANLPKPAAGEPALISFTDVITMFHEFGHALHGMFSDAKYPTLAGTSTARDFVEFPSQFNEHWASYPTIFAHYAKHYKTGAPMPEELAAKIRKAATFNKGYDMTELLAAAELDMQWHFLTPDAPLQVPDEFEKQALSRTHLNVNYVPPRYRTSYFAHIWGGGYSAGYYAYLWTEMLADDAYQWFNEHGELTRANGDRFRKMVLSRGNTEDLSKMYDAWRGGPPTSKAMLKYRGLDGGVPAK